MGSDLVFKVVKPMASALRQFTLGSMKDPGFAGLKSSIRLPIAVAIASALVLPLGNEQAIMFAFVGAFVPAATSNGFTGPWWSRLGGWLGIAAVLTVSVVLMSALSSNPWAGSIYLILLAFFITLAARISGFATVAKLPLIDGSTVALLVPGQGEVGYRVLGVCVGVGVLAVMSLILDRDKLQLHGRIADALDGLANAMESGLEPDGIAASLKGSFAELPVPVGGPRRLSALAGLVRTVEIQERLIHRCGAQLRDNGLAVQLASLDRECAAALKRKGTAPTVAQADEHLEAVVGSMTDTLKLALDDAAVDARTLTDQADVLVTTKDAALNATMTVAFTRQSLGLDSQMQLASAEIGQPQGQPGRASIFIAAILSMFSPRSAGMREALRAAIAVGLAAAVAYSLPLEHGYWIVLTTLVVLSVNAGGTAVQAVVQVVGAFAGIALSIVVLHFISSSTVTIIAMLISLFLFLYSERVLGLALSMMWLTVAMVMMLSISTPGEWRVAKERPLDVVLGAAVGVAAGLLLWPSGIARVLDSALAEAVRSIFEVSGTTARQLLTGQSLPERNSKDWSTAVGATERSIDGLGSFLMQQGKKTVPDRIYVDLVDQVVWLLYAGLIVERFVKPIVNAEPLSPALLEIVGGLEVQAKTVADSLESAAPAGDAFSDYSVKLPAQEQAVEYVSRLRASPADDRTAALLDSAGVRHWIGDQQSGLAAMNAVVAKT